MKTRTLTKIIQLSCAVVVLSVTAVQAVPITYVYTGNPFTTVPPHGASDGVTGTVTLASPLAPNMTLNDSVTPLAFTFSDGVQTITDGNAEGSRFEFATGPTGLITKWFVDVHNHSQTLAVIETLNDVLTRDRSLLPNQPDIPRFSFNQNAPGVWTVLSVPDIGSTLALLLLSLAALSLAARRLKAI